MSAEVSYVGIDNRGGHHSGCTTVDDPAEFVRVRFDRGWSRLTVQRDGKIVAQIRRHPDTNRRIWWAES